MGLFTLRKDYKTLQRLRQIIVILVKEGFHELLNRADVARHAGLPTRLLHGRKVHDQTPERMRETLEKLGPTFVKLGQLLSLRPDLIPHEYCEEFKKLQDHVEPLSYPVVKGVVEAELKKPLTKLFKTFSHEPLAAASVSQVHRATLMDGTEVVVKVQRPGIPDMMLRDVEIMEYLATKIDKHVDLDVSEIVREFKEYTARELDFAFEQRNVKRFHDFFAGKQEIIIPSAYEQLSTAKVLTLTYIDGIALSDKHQLVKHGHDLPALARIGLRAVLDQVFVLGCFHADPHPGNLFAVHRDGKQALAFIDFGIVGFIDQERQQRFLEILQAFSDNDAKTVTRLMLKICPSGRNIDKAAIEEKVSFLLQDWRGTSLKEERMSIFLYRLIQVFRHQEFRVPADVVMVAKAFLTIEGAGSWLDPELRLSEEMKPIVQQYLMNQLSPKRIGTDLLRSARRFHDVLQDLPEAAETLMDRVKDGKVELSFDKKEFLRLEHDYDLEMSKRNLALLSIAFLMSGVLLAGLARDLTFLGIPLYKIAFALFGLVLLFFIYTAIKLHQYFRERL